MTQNQKRVVQQWLMLLVFFGVIISAWFSPLENKQAALFIFVLPVYLFMVNHKEIKNLRGYGSKGWSLLDYLELNPALKVWLVLYCLLMLPFLVFKIYTSQETPYGLFVVAFSLLVGPIFIYSEIERFKEAGNDT